MYEPRARDDTIETVSVPWILDHLTDAVDVPNYDEYFIVRLVISKLDFALCQLIDCVLDQGLTVPIALCWDRKNDKLILGNGHHRFVLALLLCLDEIPVYWTDDPHCGRSLIVTSKHRYYLDGFVKKLARKAGRSAALLLRRPPAYGDGAGAWKPLIHETLAEMLRQRALPIEPDRYPIQRG
jgi:hypothetical protein